MNTGKLIETRCEEPTVIPGNVGESWQRVDYGLGASNIQSSPYVQSPGAPQQQRWRRLIFRLLIGAGLIALLYFVLSKIFWPIF